jgi:hypothetical protein
LNIIKRLIRWLVPPYTRQVFYCAACNTEMRRYAGTMILGTTPRWVDGPPRIECPQCKVPNPPTMIVVEEEV